MTRLTRRSTSLVAGLLATCALIAVGAGAVGAKTSSKGKGDSGVAYVSITRTVKGIEYAAGTNSDKVLGSGAVTYDIALLPGPSGTFKVTSKKVVLYTPTGSLTGTATATVLIGPKTEKITNGKLNLTKGAGSQKGHSYVGTFTGSADLVANQLVFNTKGTYK
jgi:hypothetical protein